MKHLFILLLIICSTITTAFAQKNQTKPTNVINILNFIISQYGLKEGQTYSVNKNPNTNIIESSERVVRFTCDKDLASIESLSDNFMKDEPISYQILHIMPDNNQYFTIKAVTGDKTKYYHIRTKSTQEMWLMCTKNPNNPQLRDAYAIAWEDNNAGMFEGTIYMITSLRPDIHEKTQESQKKVFKIEGRVDANIKDSLYNIYIADSRSALYALDDDDYVACVPVINKRFEYQTELDHPVAGRLRCIFPDGSLCSAWIDLDFVPGETYHITVHNGYYDDDEDYECRVGRYSGNSLINEEDIANVADTIDAVADMQPATDFEPTPHQMMLFQQKWQNIGPNIEAVRASYKYIEQAQKTNPAFGTVNLEIIFAQIDEKNKELDKQFHELLKIIKSFDLANHDAYEIYSDTYAHMLKFYADQSQALTELNKSYGSLPKNVQKAQKRINKLTEKYLKEIIKVEE